ncbi:site-specific integrase [Nonomuraea turkmeniaca]|uniref:Site-specific integrase n=1 Tax=Nonomuraea turkmeniaca TaxID=103838 RepID=A0A5S4EW72_9ACTN|nr:site-specific integrase [Nonomuraea turkmeniaca]TMR07753.1 site-specific integrase [Nonomuraea turkmeniaca]
MPPHGGGQQQGGKLCRGHWTRWKRAQRREPELIFEQWLATCATSFTDELGDAGKCVVTSCDIAPCGSAGLCHSHYGKWRRFIRAGGTDDAPTWARQQMQRLSGAQFSLIGLNELVRDEVLHCLQAREAHGGKIEPGSIKRVIREIERLGISTLTRADMNALEKAVGKTDNCIFLVREMAVIIGRAIDRFRGVDPTSRLEWDLVAVGLRSPVSRTGRRQQRGSKNFAEIRQAWLREVVMEWARATNPDSRTLNRWFRAAKIASRALELRPHGGHNPAALNYADMTAIYHAFKNLTGDSGEHYRAKYRQIMFSHFHVLLDFGRAAGLMDAVPGAFARNSHHRIPNVEENEDEIGKAIPETVIRQLDAHIDDLGRGLPYGRLAEDDVRAMCRMIYVILRDTGRRPLEVAALTRDCVEVIDGEYSLIYDNRKARRLRRRLPITQDLARQILDWRQQVTRLPIPAISRDWLFPAISDSNGTPHLYPPTISRIVRQWADAIPRLDSEVPGPDGRPLPFDRALIFPYGFRHAYAQRHADAGVPLDVLRDLMDHKNAQVTQGQSRSPPNASARR